MKKVLLATTNPGKREEIVSALLPLAGVELVTLDDLGIQLNVPETGTSYAENALIKARAYFEAAGIAVIAEDSGMEVSALKGELGVNTRPWGAGPDASDDEWLAHFMQRMAGELDRRARFVCHAVFWDGREQQSFEGECLGTIMTEVAGPIQKGIPLSAVFKPDGASKVYSAMDETEKNQLSHRGKAMTKLREFLILKHSFLRTFVELPSSLKLLF